MHRQPRQGARPLRATDLVLLVPSEAADDQTDVSEETLRAMVLLGDFASHDLY